MFVDHLLADANDANVVLGPVLWRPDSRGKSWYFIVAGGGPFRCEMLSTGPDLDLADEAHLLAMMTLTERRPALVVHVVDNELKMARLAALLWPCARTRRLVAAVEREQAAS